MQYAARLTLTRAPDETDEVFCVSLFWYGRVLTSALNVYLQIAGLARMATTGTSALDSWIAVVVAIATPMQTEFPVTAPFLHFVRMRIVWQIQIVLQGRSVRQHAVEARSASPHAREDWLCYSMGRNCKLKVDCIGK